MSYNGSQKLDSQKNKIFKGIPAAPGYAIGPVYIYQKENIEIYPSVSLDIDQELSAFEFAIERSKKELKKIVDLSKEKLNEVISGIFEAHLLILEDEHLLSSIRDKIKNQRHSAEYAVEVEFNQYINLMKQSNELSMHERANDIEDIKSRIIRNIQRKRWESKLKKSVIIVAKNLTPADTILFTRNDVLAYISEMGGLTSHTAILARALNIPAVVGIHNISKELQNDETVIIDGFDGLIISNPDEETLKVYEQKIQKYSERKKKYEELRNIQCKTKDNHRITLLANIDFLDEIPFAISSGAEGVGLYRSENLFFQKGSFPTEAEQVEAYIDLAEKFYPYFVTIRTFDLGGDKIFLDEEYQENNPFLGWRGIRLLLDMPEVLKTQFRAILISSTYRNIRVMLPMVSSTDEIIKAKEIFEEAKKELREARIKFDEKIKFGIMVEIPSIVYCLKEASKYIDFISVGTNDLTQYLLAVDRGNERVFSSYQEFHPALIRVLRQIIKELNRTKVEIGICGEIASNFKAVPLLIGLGYNNLSVSEYLLPEIKKLILNIKLSDCKKLAVKCLQAANQNEIINLINEFYKKIKGDNNESL
ncbi:MAG: phosphoenolpyruvate--protein phosphotransferase [Ignavibacteria bacterium]|jgi:phosphotransferase system enzyme I (PtsI)|nr:phosphoenolpyruvate--protein phosphotransferase [Ignavibacteria bacterium]MDH7528411.1 phosphoenolpyruvate--protein phosphotransferase [Ignavibacteria bacterium]NPV10512.1 phosphoenolpyruvate--protein phosphotransferase [Ignavibacteria bacterium]